MCNTDTTTEIVPPSWFLGWRKPREFLGKASNCMAQFETDEILNMVGVQHLLDAWAAGMFACIWQNHAACEVRLVEGRFPDAVVRDQSGERLLEITLADRAGREMGNEHRRLREARDRGELTVRPIDTDAEQAIAREAIPQACRHKVQRYCGRVPSMRRIAVELLVYVNLPTITGPLLTDDEMVELTRPYSHNFDAIWLLWGLRIFRAWPAPLAYGVGSYPLCSIGEVQDQKEGMS